MRLKRIRLFGFKTFAEKTEIGLDGDIVAIVGPNGCGKSNVVDALAWGLGESNLRVLRAHTGKEVIFAGSNTRKPLGFAEVAVTFDNEDGVLPVDSAEVTVARRVDRSGENDYSINRRSCRLRDVAELLADTGLSRTGYAIVGQSEIDQALAASPTQRRSWIDEAAGVQRYRLRRTEATRRLQAADEHLARASDLITELRSQEEPLAREAEEARAFRELTGRLRAVEVGLLAHELSQATQALAEGQARSASLSATVTAEGALAALAEAEAQAAADEAASAERARSEAESRRNTAEREAEQARTREEVARAKLASLTELGTALAEEREAGLARLQQAESDRNEAAAAAESAKAALDAALSTGDGLEEQGVTLRQALQAAEQALEDARRKEDARRQAELVAAHAERRAAEARRELEGAEKALGQLEQGGAEASEALAEAEAALAEARGRAQAARVALQALRDRSARADEERRAVLAELSRAEGRAAGIQASLDAHDGLAAGARAVLEAAQRGELPDAFLPVAEAVVADPEHAAAVDAALGAAANDLIVADERLAKQAVGWLRENRAGRATFQPLTLVQPRDSGVTSRLASRPGVVGVASGLVSAAPEHRKVVESLLGRVLVVRDLEAAFALVGQPGWSRAATLLGEIVHAGGAVTGGVAPRQGAGTVERKAELAVLEAETARLRGRLAEFDRQDAQSESVAAMAELEAAEAAAEQARGPVEEADAFLRAIEHERAETMRTKAKLHAELAEAASVVVPEAPDLAGAEAARDGAMREWLSHDAAAGSALARLEDARARHSDAAARLAELDKRAKAIRDAIEASQRRQADVGPTRERLGQEADAAAAERESHAAAAASAREEAERCREALERAREKAAAATAAGHASRRAIAEAEAEAHKWEVSAARHDLRRATALARLLEEYGIEEPAALALAETEPPEKDAASLAAGLRRQLKALGDVNVGAIEAYERLAARLAELEAQQADIEEGRRQIDASIRELDRLTRDRFTETFEAVRAAFGELFEQTFGGGEAELALVDPADPLDSGVDVQVTLPGKRRQRLELLSGGERALGALTLLCALLKVRPSPLVVLDEVDAPLDGRNVERFVSLLRSFQGTCQFLVVTHNQVTIESADVWLGVSMQEPGVSTVVPFRAPVEASSERVLAGSYMKG